MNWVPNIGAVALGMLAIAAACAPEHEIEEVELVGQVIEAVRPAGSILHMEGRAGESDWIDEKPHTFEIWLDGDGDRFRTEYRREWVGGSALSVTVGVEWEFTSYASDANDIFKQSITAEYQARLKDPAVFAVGYLWSLAMADEWRVLEEKSEDGRTILVIEARGIEGLDVDPGSVSVLELDKDTLWPVRQSDRIISPEGEIREGSLSLFDVVELLSPKDVPDELFSPEAVESLYVTMEEKLEQARAQGFALYWLGEQYVTIPDEPALVLYDVALMESAPRRVVVSYRPEEAWVSWVLIYEGSESWTPKAASWAAGGYSSRDVVVRGVAGVLHVSQNPSGFPFHSLVFRLGGTTIELTTAPGIKDGQEMNPFNNPEALLSLAEALVVAE